MRTFLFLIILFTAGFFTHALFFPNSFVNTPVTPQSLLTPQKTAQAEYKSNTYTNIVYKNGSFSPQRVAMVSRNHLVITNMDAKNTMWLVSDNKTLTTERAYGASEQLNVVLDTPGTYTVLDKNSSAQLVVVVQ